MNIYGVNPNDNINDGGVVNGDLIVNGDLTVGGTLTSTRTVMPIFDPIVFQSDALTDFRFYGSAFQGMQVRCFINNVPFANALQTWSILGVSIADLAVNSSFKLGNVGAQWQIPQARPVAVGQVLLSTSVSDCSWQAPANIFGQDLTISSSPSLSRLTVRSTNLAQDSIIDIDGPAPLFNPILRFGRQGVPKWVFFQESGNNDFKFVRNGGGGLIYDINDTTFITSYFYPLQVRASAYYAGQLPNTSKPVDGAGLYCSFPTPSPMWVNGTSTTDGQGVSLLSGIVYTDASYQGSTLSNVFPGAITWVGLTTNSPLTLGISNNARYGSFLVAGGISTSVRWDQALNPNRTIRVRISVSLCVYAGNIGIDRQRDFGVFINGGLIQSSVQSVQVGIGSTFPCSVSLGCIADWPPNTVLQVAARNPDASVIGIVVRDLCVVVSELPNS